MIIKEIIKNNNKCAKVEVEAILISEDGEIFYSTNYCRNPQIKCPRKKDEGYEKCKIICKQVAHAEVNVIDLAKAKNKAENSKLIIMKHRHICDNCKQYAIDNKIKEVIVVREDK